MSYQCRKCGTQVERIRIYCPGCKRKMLKGDWVRVDKPSNPIKMCLCKPCKGTGRVPGSVIDNMVITWVTCQNCGGTGKIPC